ncbi:MAG: hypothetical protein E7192_06870 [Erysipelotrichaceae bacterium]|nr:hypothetical protein [Erysipelotrichaceae bacterium]MBQ4343038.1 hypothetical protein [Erysipelotrichaceae bacterium]
MKNIILKNMKNHSNQSHFLFSVSCSCCGRTWNSPPVLYSKSNEVPANESKRIIFQSIYNHEMEKAAALALNEARTHFNFCPMCKKLVCNNCFMICEDIDMCISCAKELEEQGEIVSS